MKLALIGNCAYQALIDDQANVAWLCWPRFDSSFVFGSLLDEERGGAFGIQPAETEFSSEQAYVPNTNILRTVFRSASGSFEVLDFAPRFRQHDRFFKPTQLMRIVRPIAGDPQVRVTLRPTGDYGRRALTPRLASNHIAFTVDAAELRLTADVPLNYIVESRPFLLDRPAHLALTWNAPLEAPLQETVDTFYERTKAYWERWVKHTSLPGVFQTQVIRSALVLKLHQFEDTGAITAASTTSLPEEHGAGRNWDYRFCWIRDSYFTLRAMRRLGHFEELEEFVGFLKNVASASHERLQPVYSITGESKLSEVELEHLAGYKGNRPVRAGNAAYVQVQNDAYGEMLASIAPLLLDIRFFASGGRRDHTIRLVHRLLRRIDEVMEEPDAGLWEYRGRERVHTFTLLLHWTGARVAERIGEAIGDPSLTVHATELRRRAETLLESAFVVEDGFYGEATTAADPDASLFMMVNLGYLRPQDPKALSHVRALASRLSVRNGLMQRYRHEDDFGQSTSTFTVCGFWYAEALARLGQTSEARAVCERLLSYANHVGLFSEDLDPDTGEQLGNFPQTYSHVGLINAAFAIAPTLEELER